MKSFWIIIRIVTDMVLIPLILMLSYSLKFKVGWVFRYVFSIPFGPLYAHAQFEAYLHGSLYVMAVWMLTFYVSRVYHPFSGMMSEIDEWVRLSKAITVSSILVTAFAMVYPLIPESKSVIFYMWILGILILGMIRILYVYIENQGLKKGVGSKPTVIIGTNDTSQDLAEKMILNPRLRLKYIGFIGKEKPALLHYHLEKKFRLLGNLKEVKTICQTHSIQVMLIEQAVTHQAFFEEMVLFCEKENIELNVISNTDLLNSGIFSMSYLDDALLFSLQKFQHSIIQKCLKRMLDITIACLALLLLSPILVLVAILIKFFSPHGPVLFLQERIGQKGIPFMMIKFRSMIPDAESKTGPVIVDQEKETRYIHFVGKLIRKTSIDELPQFLNVLKGEMSIVGPRPERPFFVEKFSKEMPYYHLRHSVPVGLTGWAQINGRSVLSSRPKHKTKYDLYYIKHWSFIFDIKIILKTIKVVLSREKAY